MSWCLDLTEDYNALSSIITCVICKLQCSAVNFNVCGHAICCGCNNVECPVCHSAPLVPIIKTPCPEPTSLEIAELILSMDQVIVKLEIGKSAMRFRLTPLSFAKRNGKGESELHIACQQANLSKLNFLIHAGEDLNVKDYAGWTPLHEAVQCGSIECAEALLNAGARYDVPGGNYVTPLHTAVMSNNIDMVKLLMKHGADPVIIDLYGRSSLDFSTESVQMMNVVMGVPNKPLRLQTFFVSRNIVAYLMNVSDITASKFKTVENAVAVGRSQLTNDGGITHIIVGKDSPFDILVGMLQGIFIASEHWIDVVVKDKVEAMHTDYLYNIYKEGIKRAYINKLLQRPRLFDNMNFYIPPNIKPHKVFDLFLTRQMLIILVQAGGGKVLTREPATRTITENIYPYHTNKGSPLQQCYNFIIYEQDSPPKLMYRMKELHHMSSEWIITCIRRFRIVG